MEALDRQAETLLAILHQLPSVQPATNPTALNLNHSLSLGSLTKDSLKGAGRQKEGEHAEKKENKER